MTISKDNLVLYKNHPAVVLAVGDKIEILLPDAATRRVRDKDVQLLHPGPVQNLEAVLRPPTTTADVETAWELLQGQSTTASELSELIYGICSPAISFSVSSSSARASSWVRISRTRSSGVCRS